MEKLSADELGEVLLKRNLSLDQSDLSDAVNILKKQQITGKRALKLQRADLFQLGLLYGDVLDITGIIEDAKAGNFRVSDYLGTNNCSDPNEDGESSSGDFRSQSDQDLAILDFEPIHKYFDKNEFDQISNYEKKSYLNKLENYQMGMKLGICMPVPDFMKQSNKAAQGQPKKANSSNSEPNRKKKQQSSSSCSEASTSGSGTQRAPQDPKRNQPSTSGKAPHPQAPQNLEKQPLKKEQKESQVFAFLPSFDTKLILLNAGDKLRAVRKMLNNGDQLPEKERKLLVRTLVRYLFFEYVSHPNMVNGNMKEGMAASLVYDFTHLKDTDSENLTWHRYYNRRQNKGYIANVVANIYRHQEKKDKRRGRKTSANTNDGDSDEDSVPDDNENEEDQEDLPEDLAWLNLVMPTKGEKSKILRTMAESFSSRRKWILKEQPSITDILAKYVHLMSYDGEVLEEEFKLLVPVNNSSFLQNFPTIVKKLKSQGEFVEVQEIDTQTDCDIIGGCFYISKILPRPNFMKRKRGQETSIPEMSTLVCLVPNGINFEVQIEVNRLKAKGKPVQPYLMVLVSARKIARLFLIVDKISIQLSSTSILKGLDLLFKSYYVFNVDYPLGWKHFWEFVERGIFEINKNLLSNSSYELLKRLANIAAPDID